MGHHLLVSILVFPVFQVLKWLMVLHKYQVGCCNSSFESSTSADTWRVGGILAMSRAFGNRMLKEYVIAEPNIQVSI